MSSRVRLNVDDRTTTLFKTKGPHFEGFLELLPTMAVCTQQKAIAIDCWCGTWWTHFSSGQCHRKRERECVAPGKGPTQ